MKVLAGLVTFACCAAPAALLGEGQPGRSRTELDLSCVPGDADNNSRVDGHDSKVILGYLFEGSQAPRNRSGADANRDQRLDISDSVFINRNLIPKTRNALYLRLGVERRRRLSSLSGREVKSVITRATDGFQKIADPDRICTITGLFSAVETYPQGDRKGVALCEKSKVECLQSFDGPDSESSLDINRSAFKSCSARAGELESCLSEAVISAYEILKSISCRDALNPASSRLKELFATDSKLASCECLKSKCPAIFADSE